ncbi:MAG TPA: LamG domain-containing protein [Bryobacteraceae bacterium]|nr:LamG domain-containing protein [Bryobacteraceae bacterium]
MTTAVGAAASAAGTSLACSASGNVCLLYGMSNHTIGNGVAAVVTFHLAGSASGNLAIQLTGVTGASLQAAAMAVSTTDGTIAVGSVTVGVAPTAVSLGPSQTQQFTATVSNTSNTAVTWSVSPAVGTIGTSGLYTAPSTVASQQTVTVTATSAADTTKKATATITLNPPVAVSVTPASSTLTASQTQQFTATVSNTSNTAVTWSVSPSVGTIGTSGLYTAPATVSSQQTVTVTATSQADTTKKATATITLNPPVAVSVNPASSTLTASQTQQFTATVSNTSNTAVTWVLSPAVGTISTSGLYTAPASISTQQKVTLTAMSAADSTKQATVLITLNPLPSEPPTTGLVGYWKFDERYRTTSADSSGAGHTAQLHGTSSVAGKIRNAVSANGVSSYVSIPAINLNGKKAVTITMWVNRSYSTTGGHALIENTTDYTSSQYGFGLFPDDSTCKGIQASLQGNVGFNTACYTQPSSGVWHHLAIVYDKSQSGENQVTLYIDGVLQNPTRRLSTSANTNYFGCYRTTVFAQQGTSQFTAGTIDELRIYSRALSAAEIASVYAYDGD